MAGANQEVITADGEVIGGLPSGYESSGSLAVSLARAEVDQQIATARALPRSLKRVVGNINSLATLDDKSAEECIYALPRGGKAIKGPSIRLAEIIASQWGNCRIGARVVHVDKFEKFIEAEGVFHDLESNTATTARVRRRLVDRFGKLFNDDMIVMTGNAACSIAKRNAILGGVPKAVWRQAYDSVEAVLAGDVKTLVERRDAAMKAFAAFGVSPEQIFAALGVAGAEEITLDHMSILTGMRSAIKNGEASVEEMFPPAAAKGEKPKSLDEALDKLADGKGAAKGDKADKATKAKPAEAAKAKHPAEEKKADQPAQATAEKTDAAQNVGDAVAEQPAPATEQKPTDDRVAIAARHGREAGMLGKMKKVIPAEYGTRDAPADGRAEEWNAWMNAHKAATEGRAE